MIGWSRIEMNSLPTVDYEVDMSLLHPVTVAAFSDEVEKIATSALLKKYGPAAAVGSGVTIMGGKAVKDWQHGRRDRLQMRRQQQLQRLQQLQQGGGY
jgi:hypothetical protein